MESATVPPASTTQPPWESDSWGVVLVFLKGCEAIRTASCCKAMKDRNPAQLITVLTPETLHQLSSAPVDVARRLLAHSFGGVAALHVVCAPSWSDEFAHAAAHCAVRLSPQLQEMTLAFPDRDPPPLTPPTATTPTPPPGGFVSALKVAGDPAVLQALHGVGVAFLNARDVHVLEKTTGRAGGSSSSRSALSGGMMGVVTTGPIQEGQPLIITCSRSFWDHVPHPLSAALPKLFPNALSLISDCSGVFPAIPLPGIPPPGSVTEPGAPLSRLRRVAVKGAGRALAEEVQGGRCDGLDVLILGGLDSSDEPDTLCGALRDLLTRCPGVAVYVCMEDIQSPDSPYVSLALDPLFAGRLLLDAPGLRLPSPLPHHSPAAQLILGGGAVGGLPWPPRSEAWQHGGASKTLHLDLGDPQPAAPLAELPAVGALEVFTHLTEAGGVAGFDLADALDQTVLPSLLSSQVSINFVTIYLTLPPAQAAAAPPSASTSGGRLFRFLSQGRQPERVRLECECDTRPDRLQAIASACPSLVAAVTDLEVFTASQLAGVEHVFQGVRRLDLQMYDLEDSHGLVDLAARLQSLEVVVVHSEEELTWPEVAELAAGGRVQVQFVELPPLSLCA